MKNSKNIILNWLPPAKPYFPSPAMTALKCALNASGYNCKIIYWNIVLEDLIKEYFFYSNTDSIDEVSYLSIFYASIAFDNNYSQGITQQEILLRAIKPQYANSNID